MLVIRGQWEANQSWSYNPMLAVEVSEIGATLIALSVPGCKPLVDRLLLRKPAAGSSETGSFAMRSLSGRDAYADADADAHARHHGCAQTHASDDMMLQMLRIDDGPSPSPLGRGRHSIRAGSEGGTSTQSADDLEHALHKDGTVIMQRPRSQHRRHHSA